MARRKYHEEHVNHEAWAIPYGDLITLLLAFFVVMYAISTVSESKYRVLSSALSDAFRGPPRSITPVQPGEVIPQRVNQPQHLDIRPPLPLRPLPLNHLASTWMKQEAVKQELSDSLSRALEEQLKAGEIGINQVEDGVEISIASDFLFASGSAEVAKNAGGILTQITAALQDSVLPLRVEGHTDDVPIRTTQFPSNWELSAARAAWVVRQMTSEGIDPRRLSMLGYGEFKPRAGNETDAGRRANRRVAIIIETSGIKADAPLPSPN